MDLKEAVKNYINLGWSVIPVGADKRPLVEWKPYQERKLSEVDFWALVDEQRAQGRELFGVGVVTGRISGITVIDVDNKDGVVDPLAPLVEQSVVLDGYTAVARTGGGGRHYFFAYSPELTTCAGLNGKRGVDCRNDGGYIVLPPSKHPSGNLYSWETGRSIFELLQAKRPLVGAPLGALGLVGAVSDYAKAREAKETLNLASFGTIGQGERNATLTRVAGQLLNQYRQEKWQDAYILFESFNKAHCQPPLDEGELQTIFNSVASAERNKRGQDQRAPLAQTQASYALGFMDDLQARAELSRQGRLVGLSTGFEHLDDATLGLQAGLYVVSAITSLGKTTFAKQLADQVLQRNENTAVLFVTYEQTGLELYTKSLARVSQVSMRAIQSGKITDKEQVMVGEAVKGYQSLAERFFLCEGNRETTTENIKAMGQSIKQLGFDRLLLVIDYLQLIPLDKAHKYSSDRERIDSNLTDLRRTANALRSPVLVVSSINRDSYNGKKPKEQGEPITEADRLNRLLASFKESGNIEYSADLGVVMVEDEDKSLQARVDYRSDFAKYVNFCLVKNRSGARGIVDFVFLPETQRFIEVSKSPFRPVDYTETGNIFDGKL